MAFRKNKPEVEIPDSHGIKRTLKDEAEVQLTRSLKRSANLKGQTPEQLIHELEVHQIELETQAEELRRAHIELEESRNKFLDLYDFAPTGYLTLTDKALIKEVNLSGAILLGVERKDLVRAPFSKFMPEKDADQWHRYFMNVLRQDGKRSCTLMLIRSDNSTFPARIESIRLADSDGAITVRIAFSDITDIWQIEALKESESFNRGLVENLPDYIVVYGPDGKIFYANPATLRAMGYSEEDLVGTSVLSYVAPECRDAVTSKMAARLAGSVLTAYETDIVTYDGLRRSVIAKGTPIQYHDSPAILLLLIDITERKRVEVEREQASQEIHDLYNNAPCGYHSLNKDGVFVNINDTELKWLGCSREEIIGRKKFSDFITEKSRDIFIKNYPLFLERGWIRDLEFDIIRKDKKILTVLASATAIKNPDGSLVISRSILYDITDRKRGEEALLRVNQKLNILSQLTRKNLSSQVFVLNSYLELAKNQLAGQDQVITTLQKGVQAIRLIHETIEYSKDYQDMGAKPPTWQNVKMVLLFGLSHISIGKIQHSLETENLEIFADPLLEMVCQRLFENSVKHGDRVTRIRVWHMVTPDGATIFFEDDGIGIQQEDKEQIFLRDESTGRASMRSLIFVREILDITGITICETGEPGKGARFEITVPEGAWRIAGKGE
jgi:PAS domain S-box-containing protein